MFGSNAEDAVAALRECLNDPAPRVIEAVSAAIQNITQESVDAVSSLVATLDADSPAIRMQALFALRKLGPKAGDAIPKLVSLLHHDDWATRAQAAKVLGEIGPEAKDTGPMLLTLLRDEKKLVRAEAAQAIGKVGAPVEEFLTPNHKVIVQCLSGLLPYLTDDHLLILRSTIYPGTTELVDQLLRKAGKKSKLAFCPERVVEGKSIKELAELPQIVSGTTPEAVDEARRIFSLVAPDDFVLTPGEAELVKLFDNCYRYIHFSISNQLYMIAASADGMPWERGYL